MDKCSFKDCDKPVFVKKTKEGPLCNGHYAQFKKGKPLSALRGYNPRVLKEGYSVCPVDECERPSWYKSGLCQSHKKQVKSGKPSAIRQYNFQHQAECKIAGCKNISKSRGVCATHYRQDWGECQYPSCTKSMYNKKTGYCSFHYNQHKQSQKEE